MLKTNKQSLDNDTTDDRTNNDNDNEALLFYTKHKVELDCIWKSTDICDVITLISTIILFICLIIKIALIVSFSWFILLIPAVITIISYTISINLFIKSLDIGQEANSWGKYILINIVAVSTVTYLILFCCKNENVLVVSWLVLTIPIFIALFLAILYLIFLLPDYLLKKEYFEVSVVSIYMFSITIFTYMIHHKVDNLNSKDEPSFALVFITLFLASGWHFVYTLYYTFFYLQEKFLKRIFQIIGILLLNSSLILAVLVLDKKIAMYSYFPVVMMLFSFIFFSVFYMYKFISTAEPEKTEK